MQNFKKTKIIATIGPASEDKEVLRRMIQAGMNVARINFSHGTYEEYSRIIDTIRELGEELDRAISILTDLQGPRIRTLVAEELSFEEGESITVGELSGEAKLNFDHPNVLSALEPGQRVLIDDGLYEFEIGEKQGDLLVLHAKSAGVLKNHKGVVFPDTELAIDILSEKDLADLAFAVKAGVDYIGLSFVGSREDVEAVRAKVKELAGKDAPQPDVIAKIERKKAIQNLASIVSAADGVMVARGDLGIEMPESEVVILQKRIIAESLANAKPVIVATQMMKSMVEHPRPTRAEVSDVSNAVIDHADAVMLSEETAIGKYPVETVAMMAEIIEKTEVSPYDDLYKALHLNFHSEYATLVKSLYEMARSFQVRALVVTSLRGYTAKLISHFRPDQLLLVATQDRSVYQKLALVWGVIPVLFPEAGDPDNLPRLLMEKCKQTELLAPGNKVAVLLGRGLYENTMKLVGIQEVR